MLSTWTAPQSPDPSWMGPRNSAWPPPGAQLVQIPLPTDWRVSLDVAWESPLDDLDDSGPAGPYEKPILEKGLRLLCLAIIKQARLDSRRKSADLREPAVQFLAEFAPVWLKAMRIARAGGDPEAYHLIFGRCGRQIELFEEESLWEDRTTSF